AGDVSGRRGSLLALQHADLLTPSESEMRDALQLPDEGLPLAAWKLLEQTRANAAIVTMGPEGLIAFDRLDDDQVTEASAGSYQTRLRSEHVPALTPHAVDPLGCGDAMLAAATLALASGGSLQAAALLGASAAAREGARLGNLPCSAFDLRRTINRLHGASLAYAAPDVLAATRTAGRGVA
ncbi:MAG: PfkB family carbohydrate kinase, partial [Planctomycetota bacterium]